MPAASLMAYSRAPRVYKFAARSGAAAVRRGLIGVYHQARMIAGVDDRLSATR